MTILINPGSRVPADKPNSYENALAEARRWHDQMRGEGFGDDLDLIEPDPANSDEGRWTFVFRHRVTGVQVTLETAGVDHKAEVFPPRQYWRQSSCASPALDDWAAPGYVQTFRATS